MFQTLITFYGVKVGLNTKCMFFLLFAVSCAITLTGVGFPFFKLFSYTKFHGSNDIAHWKLNDGGYSLHLLNCLGECITCFILAFYQMSYHKDCQTFSIEVCCVENNGKKIYQPDNKLHECEQIKQVDEREEPEYKLSTYSYLNLAKHPASKKHTTTPGCGPCCKCTVFKSRNGNVFLIFSRP